MTIADFDTDAKRYDLLKDAIVAITGRTANNKPSGLYSGIENTPALTEDGTGKYLTKDGTTENTILKDLPVNNVVIGTQPPTTTDGPGSGRLWIYNGHSFIYRAQVGTDHVWDVAGVWAAGTVSSAGLLVTNGIYSPGGYTGDGWARFTAVTRTNTGEYRYSMRDAANASNYVVNITQDLDDVQGNPYDLDVIAISSRTSNSFTGRFGSDHFNSGRNAGHIASVTRIGSV